MLRMVLASAAWMAVVREEASGGRAALAVPRAVGGAGEARLAQVSRTRRRRMVMNVGR